MEIDEKTAKWKSEYKGKVYFFCGLMCKMEFDENPEKYIQWSEEIGQMNKKTRLWLHVYNHNHLNSWLFELFLGDFIVSKFFS